MKVKELKIGTGYLYPHFWDGVLVFRGPIKKTVSRKRNGAYVPVEGKFYRFCHRTEGTGIILTPYQVRSLTKA
jgi:hypothetical protein